MTDISIIIVSYKGWARLTKCLEALNEFTGNNYSTEVIIIDNKSDDDTIIRIEEQFPKFRFIYNKINGGFANGCNLGAKNATGEYFLFLNPDTVATEQEVEKLLNTARQNNTYSILSCRQVSEIGKECNATGRFPRLDNLTGFQRAIFMTRRVEDISDNKGISFPEWISGSVVFMRKATFQKLNGFDEDFWMYFEDVDICKRVRNMHGEIAFCSQITIEHNHGGSSRINIRTTSLTKTEVHISRHLYISKHKTGIEKAAIQIFLVINNLLCGGLMALLGLLLFFVPKLFARTMIFFSLIDYYIGSVIRQSWISPRSVNFKRTKEY
jgi:GT2 family glycosyltransferase